MNIENLFVFVGNVDQIAVVEYIDKILQSPPAQPDWQLPSSYTSLLKDETKRKIGVSPNIAGWVQIVESKEVVDFGMAKALADSSSGKAVVIQLSDVTGDMGFLVYESGFVREWHFDSDSEDGLTSARSILEREGIPFDLVMFREIVGRASNGWKVVNKARIR